MPLDVLLLGAPGVGKGTQAKRLSQDRGILHICSGDMLRSAIAAGTELGRKVKPICDRGDLVPDDLMVALIRERLSDGNTAGFILDGFPRTLPQAEALDAMLAEIGRRIAVVLQLQLSEEEAIRRMLGRAEHEGRLDDNPETIRHRHAVYREQTEPLIAYYLARGILVAVDAGGTVDQVYDEVARVLDEVELRGSR